VPATVWAKLVATALSIPQLTPKIRDGLTKCQIDEFESITPAVLYSLAVWTTALINVPAVDELCRDIWSIK